MKDFKQPNAGYYQSEQCDLTEFHEKINQELAPESLVHVTEIQKNIPIYDISNLKSLFRNNELRREITAEWAWVLRESSGIIVLRNAYADISPIDEASGLYEDIITDEKLKSGGGGDHFAAAGANDRIWNSLQKLCERSPDVFLRYFANEAIQAACEAWLGPNYQMTAQVNLVHPGGDAQQAHRDYHLGFQTAEVSSMYPSHVHELSPALTLQGAIAHCDMPIESGPTKLLPFSQTYLPGYAAWRRDDFREVFEDRYVQLPLKKGDALFFSPALFHAAGKNVSGNIHRMVNLLQISSAFGRAMETIDRTTMCILTYPHATRHFSEGTLSISEIKAAIAATAEGYSFPTNLDNDPPKGGLAPETQQTFYLRALESEMKRDEFEKNIHLMDAKRTA
jgi:ectoine hydroxylase-related dioxygenase (phytanoyl-CoA dioxygenase family)